MIRKIFCVVTLLATVLCASELTAQPTVKEVIVQAEAARKEAESIGFEWSSTASLIKNAQAALDAGKEEEARKIASKALYEALQSVQQGQNMKKNWETLIPKP